MRFCLLFAIRWREKCEALGCGKIKRGASSLSRRGGWLFGALRGVTVGCASLSFIAPAPGHLLQRFEEVNQLPIRKGTVDPGVKGANKTPAIRDQAIHRLSDTWVKVSAGINTIVFGKTGSVSDLLCICDHRLSGKLYT
jgi:hypothetical protein